MTQELGNNFELQNNTYEIIHNKFNNNTWLHFPFNVVENFSCIAWFWHQDSYRNSVFVVVLRNYIQMFYRKKTFIE